MTILALKVAAFVLLLAGTGLVFYIVSLFDEELSQLFTALNSERNRRRRASRLIA